VTEFYMKQIIVAEDWNELLNSAMRQIIAKAVRKAVRKARPPHIDTSQLWLYWSALLNEWCVATQKLEFDSYTAVWNWPKDMPPYDRRHRRQWRAFLLKTFNIHLKLENIDLPDNQEERIIPLTSTPDLRDWWNHSHLKELQCVRSRS